MRNHLAIQSTPLLLILLLLLTFLIILLTILSYLLKYILGISFNYLFKPLILQKYLVHQLVNLVPGRLQQNSPQTVQIQSKNIFSLKYKQLLIVLILLMVIQSIQRKKSLLTMVFSSSSIGLSGRTLYIFLIFVSTITGFIITLLLLIIIIISHTFRLLMVDIIALLMHRSLDPNTIIPSPRKLYQMNWR